MSTTGDRLRGETDGLPTTAARLKRGGASVALSTTGAIDVAPAPGALATVTGLADKGGQVFNVRAFGAVGDGVADDTAALQAALDAAGDVAGAHIWDGAVVDLSHGLYKYTSTLTVKTHLTIRGADRRGTQLRWYGGAAPAIKIHDTTVSDGSDTLLENFSIKNYGTGTIGVWVTNFAVRVTLRRIGSSGSPVSFSDAIVKADYDNVFGTPFYWVLIDDCYFAEDNAGAETPRAVYARGGHSLMVHNTFMSGYPYGVYTEGLTGVSDHLLGLDVSGCEIENFAGLSAGHPGGLNAVCVYAEDTWGVAVHGCRFLTNGAGDASANNIRAIKLGADVHGVSVAGSVFFGGGAEDGAIDVSDANVRGVSIAGNTFYNYDRAIVASGTGDLTRLDVGANEGNNLTVELFANTWTPAMTFGGSSTGVTYAKQKGWYARRGHQLRVWGTITLTNNGSGVGAALVTGLPLASLNEADNYGVGTAIGFSMTTPTPMVAMVYPNQSTIHLFAATTTNAITDADLGNAAEIQFALEYELAHTA